VRWSKAQGEYRAPLIMDKIIKIQMKRRLAFAHTGIKQSPAACHASPLFPVPPYPSFQFLLHPTPLPYLGHGHGSIMSTVNEKIGRILQAPHHHLLPRRVNDLGQRRVLA